MAPIVIPPDDPGDHGKDDGTTTIAGSVEITNDVGSPIPVSGTVDIGTIPEVEIKNDAGSPVPVSGSVTAIAQPGVDIGDVTVNNAAGAAAVNIQDGGNSITVDGPLTDAELRATAVPVSGTVTANAGTNLNTSNLALSATQTDGTQRTKVTDGSNNAAVKAASTAAAAADPALVVSLSPNSIGDVNVRTESYGGLLHGQNSDIDSGANEQIVVASNVATKGVLVKALSTNTGTIYIGGSGVTSANGIPLAAGESITIPVADANQVYAIASVDDQALAWMAS